MQRWFSLMQRAVPVSCLIRPGSLVLTRDEGVRACSLVGALLAAPDGDKVAISTHPLTPSLPGREKMCHPDELEGFDQYREVNGRFRIESGMTKTAASGRLLLSLALSHEGREDFRANLRKQLGRSSLSTVKHCQLTFIQRIRPGAKHSQLSGDSWLNPRHAVNSRTHRLGKMLRALESGRCDH